jgi:membrane protein DedA with SNARE-associated domain
VLRQALLALAALRGVLALVAIPLAPALYEDHVAVLVLLRPTKEVFLFAGYKAAEHEVNLGVVVLAATPLLVLAVWVFYFLGRAYHDELSDADLPGIAGRVLPRTRIESLCEAVSDRGWPLVFIGRLAIMPSTLVAAAAGTADVPVRTFLAADAAGAMVSMVMMLAAGYFLGEAREAAGPWFSVLGAAALLGLMFLLGKRVSGGGRRRAGASRSS